VGQADADTRQFSDEATLTPSNLGLSLAAFELGPADADNHRQHVAIELRQLMDGNVTSLP
jgi:hypothetical protein